MRCSPTDVKTASAELQKGLRLSGTHHDDFPMRREQAEAVEQTLVYYQSRWAEDAKAVPRFLWHAQMRFGKTFTSSQLAKQLNAKRVLVLTIQPAVEASDMCPCRERVSLDVVDLVLGSVMKAEDGSLATQL